MFYGIEMDYGEPIKYFANLKLVFEELQREGHISVYGPDSKKYQAAAKEEGINPSKYTCYVKTSTYEEGRFYESLSLWIEDCMDFAFGDPTCRPYYEAYFGKRRTGRRVGRGG